MTQTGIEPTTSRLVVKKRSSKKDEETSKCVEGMSPDYLTESGGDDGQLIIDIKLTCAKYD